MHFLKIPISAIRTIRTLAATILLMPQISLADGTLFFSNGVTEKTYNQSDLLKRPDVNTLHIPLLNYPDQDLEIKAIPIRTLLKESGIQEHHYVLFKALDGFSGMLDQTKLMNADPSQSMAYLAIESTPPWPPLPKTNNKDLKSAGPFYLVWQNPSASDIPPEAWPYQLSGFRFESDLKVVFPLLFPKTQNKMVQRGFNVYKARCMSCHTINKQGTSQLGPDLNIPKSPVEYFKPSFLKKFLKDPSSLRQWPSMKMIWVKGTEPTDKEIDELIAYLSHMAKTRP